MGKIKVNDINKTFENGTIVFDDFDVTIEDGSFTVILGPSGCGKSTLLRMIAGLESVTEGELYIDDEDITHSDPRNRDIAMVFQNYALYPHMTAYQNIEYSLKIKGMDKKEREKRVMEALEIVQIDDLKDRKPSQLSGGQQQRIALARAIVKQPAVFLMDEPLSNLDAKLRNEMRDMISALHKRLETTFVFVTHDQGEAMSLASDIILLDKGQIRQHGSPKDLYTNPNNLFTAQFIGSPPANILTLDDEQGYVAIRPEDIRFDDSLSHDNSLKIQAEFQDTQFIGSDATYRFETKYGDMIVKDDNTWEKTLDVQSLTVALEDVIYFDSDGERINDREEIKSLVGRVN